MVHYKLLSLHVGSDYIFSHIIYRGIHALLTIFLLLFNYCSFFCDYRTTIQFAESGRYTGGSSSSGSGGKSFCVVGLFAGLVIS